MSTDKILFQHDEIHGPGEVYFVWQTGGTSQYLATTGSDATVAIFNRQGQLQERLILQGLCCGFSWDPDGDLLGIIQLGSSQIILWDSNTKKKLSIDIGLRDPPSSLIWSKKAKILAVGTNRGNLSIYNHQTTKRVPIIGKHTKRITCGAWSNDNLLALGSDDKQLSISNDEGDTLRLVTLREIPSDMYFAEMKTDERINGENTVSMILGKRTLYLYHLPEPDSPIELGFQQRYGSLIQHKWFGDGYILLGFSLGNIVVISTHPREVGQELWQVKNHRDTLSSIAINNELQLISTSGDNNIKIHSMTNLQETTKILTLSEQTGIKNIDWCTDGQLLAVTTNHGALSVFITKLPPLYAVSAPRIAILSSLAEVSIYHYATDKIKTTPNIIPLEIEPQLLSIGQKHLACGMNNHIWFYDIGNTLNDQPLLLGDHEYMSGINDIKLNAHYCAVLSNGKVILHQIQNKDNSINNYESNKQTIDNDHHDTKIFPDCINNIQDAIITCMNLTNDFLIFATDLGNIIHFSIEQWTVVVQYRHTMGIKNIATDLDGTKVVIVDDHNQGYIFLPTVEEIITIPNFPKQYTGCLWDIINENLFIIYDNKIIIKYYFARQTINGKLIIKIDEVNLLTEQIPLMLNNNELCLYTNGGNIATLNLDKQLNLTTNDNIKENLIKLRMLRKYDETFELCKLLNDYDEWNLFGNDTIYNLNIKYAIKIYRYIGNVSMVYALEDIKNIEDINLLSGYCSLLLNQIDNAKLLFTKSIKPYEALELCCDLLQWEQAILLAENLSPEKLPIIAREYAQQLEFNGNNSEALVNYQKGLNINDDDNNNDETLNKKKHFELCKAGIARTSIKCGDYRKGMKLALELNNKQLILDCAESLKNYGHLLESANLYEKGENYDDACLIYIELKSYNKIDNILKYCTNIKLYNLHGKIKENLGDYHEAIKSYKKSGDLDNCVRIYLDYLSDPISASDIVNETKTIQSSKMLSRFYQQIGDYNLAIKYLIICGCIEDGFSLAQKYNKLKYYGELLENYDNAKINDYLVLAKYFDNEKYTLLAGKYYFLAKDFKKSLKLLLKASSYGNTDDENIALSLAIDCCATSNDDHLTKQLIEYFLGENDGMPKDPKYLFRLYMAKKQYKEAAKTAIIIASQEQINGNYRNSHDLLLTMYQELKRNNLIIGNDMKFNLILLHRYILVRIHVKNNNHKLAAKLLVQVAINISQFPSHIVPILTSTVIECQRAGFKKSAYSYAVLLMRPEYRNQIDQKYIKKIEAIVRKTPKDIKDIDDETNLDTMKCPVCDFDLQTMEITCGQCKTNLPICIATGQHMINDDAATCPECDFTCIKSEMSKILETTNQCPMCNETVDSNRLIDITDINQYITNVA